MKPYARRGAARLVLGLPLIVGIASNAQAQMQVPGGTGVTGMPSPAVFGGARREQPGTNTLSISGSVLGGYDTNILADNAGVGGGSGGNLGSTEQTESSFAGGSASLQWMQNRARASYFGSAGASYRKMFDIDDFDVQAYYAGGGVGFQLTKRSSVSLNANVDVQPFYQFGVLGNGLSGGLALDPTAAGPSFVPDYQAAREQILRFGGSAGYSYQISPRTTFTADASRYGSRPLNDEAESIGLANLGSTTVGARITRRLTSDLGLRLGYGYTMFDTVDTSPLLPGETGTESVGVHNIDVGLDYSKALTVARRTSFSFGTGTSVTRRANNRASDGQTEFALDGQTQFASEGTQFNVTGFATLQREFLRTWAASLNYTRFTSYIEGFNDFGVFDTAAASIGGLFSDRLDGNAGVFYTNGAGISIGGRRLSNLNAGGQLRYAMTQNLAAFVTYTYTYANIPDEFRPQGLLDTYKPERQGVRVGLTVWLDLLR